MVSLVTVVAFESLAISTVMPIVERELGQIWLYGWVFAAFFIGTLIGVVVGGNVVDHVRPIRPMMVGIALFVAGLFVGGLAVSMDMLVAGRLLQGLGAGVVPAVSYVVVARGFPAQMHPKVFAAMSSAWVMPALISPLLASYIARHVSWRWVFLGLIPVTVAVTAVGAPRVALVGKGERAGQLDGLGSRRIVARVVALAIGAAMAISGLSAGDPLIGWPVAAIGIGILVVIFRMLTPAGTLTFTPRLPAAVMLRGMLTYAFFSADAFVSLAVTSVRGMSTTFAGVSLVCSSASWTVGSWLQARFMNRASSGPGDASWVGSPADSGGDAGAGAAGAGAAGVGAAGAATVGAGAAGAGAAGVGAAGAATVGAGAAGAGAAGVAGHPGAARHRVSSRLVRSGGVMLALGAMGETISLSSRVPVWFWLVSSTTMGLGMGLAYTTISVVALAEAESGREGEATASLQLSDILGTAMGTGMAGAFVAIGDRLGVTALVKVLPIFVVSMLVAALVAMVGYRLARRPPQEDAPAVPVIRPGGQGLSEQRGLGT